MTAKPHGVLILAILAIAAGCAKTPTPPTGPRPPASIAFMSSATYIGVYRASSGERRPIWRLNLPFKEALRQATEELSGTKGWQRKSVIDSQMTFVSMHPKRAVMLFEGAKDKDLTPILGTNDTATTIVTDGF